MKITNTRLTEQKLIGIYAATNCKNKDESLCGRSMQMLKTLIVYFDIISIFSGVNHTQIVQKLYFCKENILKIGTRKMAEIVFVQERTLLEYRQKYCKIANYLISNKLI